MPRPLGYKLSKATKLKMSLAAKGRVFSAEHKLNLSKSHKGHLVLEATKNKISKANSGNKHPNWHGGINKDRGYVRLYKPDHPYGNKNGYVLLSHLVMTEHLGRLIQPNEIVHHINEDKTDNRIENLMVVSRDEHPSYHRKQKNLL